MQNVKDTLSVLLNQKIKSGDRVLRVMDCSMYRDYYTKYDISILSEDRQIHYQCLLAELVLQYHKPKLIGELNSTWRIKRDQFLKDERDVLEKLDIEITHHKVKDSLTEEV